MVVLPFFPLVFWRICRSPVFFLPGGLPLFPFVFREFAEALVLFFFLGGGSQKMAEKKTGGSNLEIGAPRFLKRSELLGDIRWPHGPPKLPKSAQWCDLVYKDLNRC